jgi:hypothetical protein
MWSAASPSLEIERRPFGEQLVAVGCCVAGSIVPWLLPLTTLQSSLFTVVAIAVVCVTVWRAGFVGARYRVVKAVWDHDGQWWLIDASGLRQRYVLSSAARVTPPLIWLHWRGDRGARQMLLFRWTLSRRTKSEEWRRLAVRLRLEGAVTAPDGSGGDPAPSSRGT